MPRRLCLPWQPLSPLDAVIVIPRRPTFCSSKLVLLMYSALLNPYFLQSADTTLPHCCASDQPYLWGVRNSRTRAGRGKRALFTSGARETETCAAETEAGMEEPLAPSRRAHPHGAVRAPLVRVALGTRHSALGTHERDMTLGRASALAFWRAWVISKIQWSEFHNQLVFERPTPATYLRQIQIRQGNACAEHAAPFAVVTLQTCAPCGAPPPTLAVRAHGSVVDTRTGRRGWSLR